MIVGNKKFPMTVEGMQHAEEIAREKNLPIQADQSVYGEGNASPLINPDSNTEFVDPNPPVLDDTRNNSLRRKAPRPYKAKRNLY